MIELTKAYVVNGVAFASLEEAQIEELSKFFKFEEATTTRDVAVAIVENRDKIMDVLTTKPNSRPKARKANGGTKRRKAPAAAAQEPPVDVT